jgi:hypothetical protein
MRANERFSGRNHRRHLCRECAHLPAEELEYRQGERDVERLLHEGLYVPRRRRAQFNRFLEHPNARVRKLALEILAEQRRQAEERRRRRHHDEDRSELFDDRLSESPESRGDTPDVGEGESASPGAGESEDPF